MDMLGLTLRVAKPNELQSINCYLDWNACLTHSPAQKRDKEQPPPKERIEEETWKAMTKDQRKWYHKGVITAAEARKLVRQTNRGASDAGKKTTATAEDGPSEADSGVVAMKTDADSLIGKELQTSFTKHFKAVTKPNVKAKPLLEATEFLKTLLPQSAGISAETAELKKELEELEQFLQGPTATGQVKAALQTRTKELENLIGEHAPPKDAAAANSKEIAALGKVLQDLELSAADRLAAKEKHVEAKKARQEEFKAQMSEAKKRLELIEQEYAREDSEAAEAWLTFNQQKEARDAEVMRLAETRLEGLKTETNHPHVQQERAQEKAIDQQSPLAVATNAAAQGNLEAQRILAQLEYRAPVEQEDLRDFQLEEMNESETPLLAQMHAFWNGMLMEDQAALVNFGQAAVPMWVMIQLLGEKAWKMIFPQDPPKEQDAIPYQLRQLIVFQLQSISHKLQEAQHDENRQKGKQAMKKAQTKIRDDTAKLKKTINK